VYGTLQRQGSGDDSTGGMAPRVHLIRGLQAGGPTVVLDAGDALGPETLSAWDQGKAMVAAMRLAGYAAMVPGNHDFGHGPAALTQRADEAGFPFLAANVKGKGQTDLPLESYLLVEAGPVRIGIVGLASPGIAKQTNPRHVEGLEFGNPAKAGGDAVRALLEQGAQYVVALVHMPELEALALARQIEGIDLVIAGGYSGLDQAANVPSLTRLVNGVHLVTTPRFGPYLGRVEILFRLTEGGAYQATATDASLIRVGMDVPGHPETEAVIRQAEANYVAATGDVLGSIEGQTLEDQAAVVANLMRLHTDVEVGIVNTGAFQEVASGEPLRLSDIYEFIRFDDLLVEMTLTGRDLRSIAKRSRSSQRSGRGLAFAGLDPKEMTVNRRPVRNQEVYRVVVLEYLARGGDGYREFPRGRTTAPAVISLRSLVINGLEVWGTLSSAALEREGWEGVWRSGWSTEGSFRRNYVNETTEIYRAKRERVSFLRGETSIAWDTATRFFLGYESGSHAVLFENTNDFGQVGHTFSDLESSSDRLDLEATYRYRLGGLRIEPVFSSGIGTAFTKSSGTRPFLWRNSLGVQRRLTPYLVARFAGRGQRDYTVDQTDFGAEVTLSYQRRTRHGGRFRSRVKSFFGLTDRKVVSVENTNTFSFPLVGGLDLTVRQNNFIYRVDRIRDEEVSGVALRTDLTVGFSYGLDWKWF
ncbi:MAG: 5'-nucleotidase C-terminal domain-containing protein, partial [Candidatus Latescibacteria bacterium]|jgi:2',3'-cyclic-nucleotide 2'-phosphodiesterase (5'-nucleotidase family)|nr:5'-nucleotidase C-terminal domain-containing protein [Candidatus Latescibacterota bacterium]